MMILWVVSPPQNIQHSLSIQTRLIRQNDTTATTNSKTASQPTAQSAHNKRRTLSISLPGALPIGQTTVSPRQSPRWPCTSYPTVVGGDPNAHSTTDSTVIILVAVIPNPPERLITSPFVQNLICSQNDEVMHSDQCGAHYRSTS